MPFYRHMAIFGTTRRVLSILLLRDLALTARPPRGPSSRPTARSRRRSSTSRPARRAGRSPPARAPVALLRCRSPPIARIATASARVAESQQPVGPLHPAGEAGEKPPDRDRHSRGARSRSATTRARSAQRPATCAGSRPCPCGSNAGWSGDIVVAVSAQPTSSPTAPAGTSLVRAARPAHHPVRAMRLAPERSYRCSDRGGRGTPSPSPRAQRRRVDWDGPDPQP